LSYETQVLIVSKLLAELQSRLKTKNVEIQFDESLKKAVIDSAFDPEYGARPIKRYIQRYIETEIARAIVSQTILPHQKYLMIYQNESYQITKA
jgi:ATP-dependent Clp protease ATP-binding subunit ClpB